VDPRFKYCLGIQVVAMVEGIMPRPKAHYSVVAKNHVSGERLKVELIDLPFVMGKRFRLRVNGLWARKVPTASKTSCWNRFGRGWPGASFQASRVWRVRSAPFGQSVSFSGSAEPFSLPKTTCRQHGKLPPLACDRWGGTCGSRVAPWYK
jgi:hypothetical protein